MVAVPSNEQELINSVYRELADILNARIIRNPDVQRPKVAVAVMSITTAWLIAGLEKQGDDISICEEAMKRSLRAHLERCGIAE